MVDDAREPVLVSACLLGQACRYDGRHNRDERLEDELAARGQRAVPFCPEEHGGLGTPRPSAWIAPGPPEDADVDVAEAEAGDDEVDGGTVLDGLAHLVDEHGHDVTEAFLTGAHGALELCLARGIQRAYLKERSPSCGVRCTHVHDQVVDGPGVTAALLRRSGVECTGVEGRRSRDEG